MSIDHSSYVYTVYDYIMLIYIIPGIKWSPSVYARNGRSLIYIISILWYMGYCHPTIIGNSCKVGILLYPCLWIFMRDCHPFDVNITNVLTWSQRWRKQQTSAFQAQLFETYEGFHKWGYPKMDGLKDIRENLIKLDDLGVPLFQETLILRLVHSLKLWPPLQHGIPLRTRQRWMHEQSSPKGNTLANVASWENHRTKWWIFRCHVWLPEGSISPPQGNHLLGRYGDKLKAPDQNTPEILGKRWCEARTEHPPVYFTIHRVWWGHSQKNHPVVRQGLLGKYTI